MLEERGGEEGGGGGRGRSSKTADLGLTKS